MSTIESVLRPKKLINFDRILLVAVSVLVLSHAGLCYVCLHYNLPFVAASNLTIASLVLTLPLPVDVARAIIDNFFMLVVGECFAAILTIRFIKLKTVKSPALLARATLLIAYHFVGADAFDYAFDQIRFQVNKEAYLAIARSSEGWPDSAVIHWGESGFLDSSIQYYLVFDRTGTLARGEIKPEGFGWKAEHMECDGSMRRLSSDFYSVRVSCVGT